MAASILILPFISGIVCGLGGRFIGANGSKVSSFVLLGTATILSQIYFWSHIGETILFFLPWFPFFIFEALYISAPSTLIWDPLSSSASAFLLFPLSLLVHLFAFSYLKEDPHLPRFLSLLSFFTGSMALLLFSSSLIFFFFAWEFLALSSFLLISWYSSGVRASLSSIFMNRLGDTLLILTMSALYSTYWSWSFLILFFFKATLNLQLLLFFSALVKSAQFGLHSWLPKAMAAPTPVSSFLHSASLVVAGIILLIRLNNFLDDIHYAIIILGSFTAFYGAIAAAGQRDIKRVIAFSTLSNLGIMALGIPIISTSWTHIILHAWFKCLYFISAGAIILSSNGQSITRMGGLKSYLPIPFATFTMGALANFAFPGTSGFYSKEAIIEALGLVHSPYITGAIIILSMAICGLSLYSCKMILGVWIITRNGSIGSVSVPLNTGLLNSVLVILAMASTLGGYHYFLNEICSGDIKTIDENLVSNGDELYVTTTAPFILASTALFMVLAVLTITRTTIPHVRITTWGSTIFLTFNRITSISITIFEGLLDLRSRL